MSILRTGEPNHIKALVILWRLGRQRRFIPRIIRTYTRLVWCIDGRAKGIDVGWFGSSGGFLGVVGQRAARPYYQENIAGAEWVAVSNQFFTTLMAPLTAKATGVWGRRFDDRAFAGSKTTRHRGSAWHAGISVAARANLQRAFRNLCRAETLPSSRATSA